MQVWTTDQSYKDAVAIRASTTETDSIIFIYLFFTQVEDIKATCVHIVAIPQPQLQCMLGEFFSHLI